MIQLAAHRPEGGRRITIISLDGDGREAKPPENVVGFGKKPSSAREHAASLLLLLGTRLSRFFFCFHTACSPRATTSGKPRWGNTA
jgi:hypothetical protein